MIEKIKEIFFSDKGMKIVNILFILSLFVQNSGLIFIAYLIWIVYLVFGMKHTQSKIIKISNFIFIIFAAIMIMANVLLWLNYI
ncbi:MAG: hypothetical protein PHP50_01870 [Lachnospiraceae bacterium]|nr:hypothetical protein [Lachnospiraceae bacterium]